MGVTEPLVPNKENIRHTVEAKDWYIIITKNGIVRSDTHPDNISSTGTTNIEKINNDIISGVSIRREQDRNWVWYSIGAVVSLLVTGLPVPQPIQLASFLLVFIFGVGAILTYEPTSQIVTIQTTGSEDTNWVFNLSDTTEDDAKQLVHLIATKLNRPL